jgi:serine/threonine protein kinase
MGPYQIVRPINEGGFGRVSLAQDTISGQFVAIKELHKVDGDSRARFERELRVLQEQINNRYVVDVFSFNFDTDPPFIVMEYCDGGSLRGWVNNRRPWETVASALGHVAEGLAGIHKAGGFHRDIKPDNLLLANLPDYGLTVKVADFGLARIPQRNTSTMTYGGYGTPGYIAPEIMMGADFHPGADIYSLGVVALELLTGTTDAANLNHITAPEALKQLVRAMLSRASVNRPNIQRVAKVLNEVLTMPQPPQPLVAPAPASSSGSGAGVALGIGAALLAIGGLAYLASNAPEWDGEVQRYRGKDGRFRRS